MAGTMTIGVKQASPSNPAGQDEFADSYDVIVVGGGAAGLSGALALGRSRRSVLVIDDGAPRNASAGHVHNYLGSEGVPPAALVATGRAEVAAYGVQIVEATAVAAERIGPDSIDGVPTGDRFRVRLNDDRSVRARRLLVATGLVDVLPDVPGVVERWGRDVLHCPFCHGWEVRDQAIGILATGPMAVHQALLFRRLSADVVFFRHTEPSLPDEEADQLAASEIAVVDGEVAALAIEADRLVGVRLRSGEVVPRQAVVVAPRFEARAAVLEALGVAMTELEVAGRVIGRHAVAEANGATNVPGVWVAGNVTSPMAQVIAAAAAGLLAGAAIHGDLVSEDTGRAVGSRRGTEVASSAAPLSSARP